MDPHRLDFAAVLSLVAVLLLPAPAAAKGGSLDMGDAPDARFPSKVASRGPQHSGLGALLLGRRVDGEADSEQVNADRHDDGAEARVRRCSDRSRLELMLNGKGLSAAQRAAGSVVYVNAWFDWNRDGDWDDTGGCAPEWAIQNLSVPAGSLGSRGLRFLPIRFKAGAATRNLWWRVTVTLNEPAIDPGGRGRPTPYALGETEDYFIPPRGGGGRDTPFTSSCVPNPALILHGGTANVKFAFNGGRGTIYGKRNSPKMGKGYKVGLNVSPNQRGVPPGSKRIIGFKFKSSDIDPPLRLQKVDVVFTFTRKKETVKIGCRVFILHFGKHRGKGKHKKPPKVVPVRCKDRCAGVELTKVPPTEGIDARYDYVETELLHLELRGMAPVPLRGFEIPLGPPNPVPRDAPQLRSSNPSAQCFVHALEGGPPVFGCFFGPRTGGFDSFFDIFSDIDLGGTPLSGRLLDAAGNPFGSFEAQRGLQQVQGQGQFNYPGGDQIQFAVAFNAQLGGFLLDFPAGFQVLGGNASGFSCQNGDFEGHTNGALICSGSVQPNQPIQGMLQLNNTAPPDIHMQSRLFGFAGGQQHGPFPVSGP